MKDQKISYHILACHALSYSSYERVCVCVNVTTMAFTKFILSFFIHPKNILLALNLWGVSVGWKQQFLPSTIEQGKKTYNKQAACVMKKGKQKESRWTLKMVDRNCVWKSIRSQYTFESILTIRFCFYVDKGLMITNSGRIRWFSQPLRVDQHISCIFKRFE